MKFIFCLIPFLAFTQTNTTLLNTAQEVSKQYLNNTEKLSPQKGPQTYNALQTSSTWLTFDARVVAFDAVFDAGMDLTNPKTWLLLNQLGFDGIYPQNILQDFNLNASWQMIWPTITALAQKNRISLIGQGVESFLPIGLDFALALQNESSYLDLFHLVEIPENLWNLLPEVSANNLQANIPWLSLQKLQNLGFVPFDFNPYVKQSNWDATKIILGADGKNRRWIYHINTSKNPTLNFSSPLFSSFQLSLGKAINQIYNHNFQFIKIDGSIANLAQDSLSSMIGQMKAFSFATTNGTIKNYLKCSSDLCFDSSTQIAAFHALACQDAEALRLIYRLFKENNIDVKRLIHTLSSFDKSGCNWEEFLHSPKGKYKYYDEELTGDMLRNRLLNQDISNLQQKNSITPSTWVDYCARALKIEDFEKNKDLLTKAHLLFTFFYAMQPGVLTLSYDDLVGMLPQTQNQKMLYLDLQGQEENAGAFIYKVKKILDMRSSLQIALADFVGVLPSSNIQTLLLLHRLPTSGYLQITAINFSSSPAEELILLPEIAKTRAIDTFTQMQESKVFSSSEFTLKIPPMSGKSTVFIPNAYP